MHKEDRIKGLVMLTLICLIAGSVSAAPSTWFSASWDKARNYTIENPSNVTVINYGVQVNVTFDSDMNANFSDIRFTNSSNWPLNYYLFDKVDSDWAMFFVNFTKIAETSNETLWVYYDNTAAGSLSDAKKVSPVSEDCEDNDISQWTLGGIEVLECQTVTVIDGTRSLHFNGAGQAWETPAYMGTAATVPNSARLFFKFRSNNTEDASTTFAVVDADYSNGFNFLLMEDNSITDDSFGAYDTAYRTGTTWVVNTNYVLEEYTNITAGLADSYLNYKSTKDVDATFRGNPVNMDKVMLGSHGTRMGDVFLDNIILLAGVGDHAKEPYVLSIGNEEKFFPGPAVVLDANITPTTVYSGGELFCNATVEDAYLVHYWVFNESDTYATGSAAAINLTLTNYVNITAIWAGENWSCGFMAQNASTNSTQVNTTVIMVSKSPPTLPVLELPINSTNTSTTTPFFNWSVSTDVEGDAITYGIEVCNDSGCAAFSQVNYTLPSNNFTVDALADGHYWWRVKAITASANSSYTAAWKLTINNTAPGFYSWNINDTEIYAEGSVRLSVLVNTEKMDIVKFYSAQFGNITATDNYPEYYVTCNASNVCLTTSNGNYSFISIWGNTTLPTINSTVISLNFSIVSATPTPPALSVGILASGYSYNFSITAAAGNNYTILRFKNMESFTTHDLKNIYIYPQSKTTKGVIYMNETWGSGEWDVFEKAGDTLYIDRYNNLTWTPTYTKKRRATAINHCSNLDYGGFNDWELPNNATLQTLCRDGGCNGSECWDYEGYNESYGSSTLYDATNQQGVNFTTCDMVHTTINFDSYYVRCVRNATTWPTNNMTKFRLAVNTTVTKTFDVRIGGYDINGNFTNLSSIYITNHTWDMRTLATSDFSQQTDTFFYKVSFRWEENNSIVNMDMMNGMTFYSYMDTLSNSFDFKEQNTSTLFLVSDSEVDEFRATINWDGTNTYFRDIIPFDERDLRMYLINLDNSTSVGITYTLDDLTAAFSPAYIRVKKNQNGTLYDMHSGWFDADNTAFVYLINNERYVLTVGTDSESRSLGWLTIRSGDTTKTITISGALDFSSMYSPYDFINWNFTFNHTNSKACLVYNDSRERTNSVMFFVYYADNGTQIYNITSYSQVASLCYVVPDQNETYRLVARIDHPDGSIWDFVWVIDGLHAAGEKLIDMGFDAIGNLLGLEPNTWYMIFSVGAIAVVGTMFSASLSAVGGVVISLMAMFFAYVGWLSVSAGIIALMFIVSVVNMFTKNRRVE